MSERHDEEVRSDYNRENQYSVNHPDAQATGDAQGKGVGGGMIHSLPDCSGTIGVISYAGLVTSPSAGAGNADDNNARNTSFSRMLYSYENQYSSNSVDTSSNVKEGQYVMP